MIFFIIVHKNNNKVTLRTLAVNARGQKAGKVEFFSNHARLFQFALLLGTSEYVVGMNCYLHA